MLGVGGCAYGLVLLFLSARALGVGRVVISRLTWLAAGSAAYALSSLALDGQGGRDLVVAAVWSAIFWGGFFAAVPLLRSDVQLMFAKWKTLR